jgi:UDP-N-acetylmuramate dehydrogenase
VLIEENIPLAPFTTFGIGGPARWLVRAQSEVEIVSAIEYALSRSLPLFILGGGSNLLVSDAGFDGLILHVALRGVTQEGGRFKVAAGEEWDSFVVRAVKENYAGIECLAGIPGTVGGTPVQNVGAYGQEVASTIERVRAYDLTMRNFVELTNEECGFHYRRSRFNSEDRGRFIVTRVDYRLARGGQPTLNYIDLKKIFPEGSSPTLVEVAAAVRKIRQTKGMLIVEGDADCRSAGSFFKNPVITEQAYAEIAASSANPPQSFSVGPRLVKIPAAWLIEQAGFPKGYVLGNAAISSRHTLALINKSNTSAAEVLALRDKIVSGVEANFGITLEMEPVLLGF